MRGERLDGGNTGGAVRIGDTVRRAAGPWTPAVHALLHHLAAKGFGGAPRPLGIDGQGREVLAFLPGETVGARTLWPAWVYADETLDQVARWLRSFHAAVADFVPPPGAVWREGGRWTPGLIIAHNDTGPYNAVYRNGTMAGFFDWDFAGPASPEADTAFTALTWVPLHARHVVTRAGFTNFGDRPRRLRRFLETYGWHGDAQTLIEITKICLQARIDGIRRLAAAGNPLFGLLVRQGVADNLSQAVTELDDLRV